MSNADKNCHDYCPYAKMCKYTKGEVGLDPYECGNYYKYDDLMNEAKDIEREIRREAGLEDVDDWEDYL